MPLLWPVPTNQPPMKDLCNVIALANIKCIYVTVTMCTRQGTMLSMTTCFAWVEALIPYIPLFSSDQPCRCFGLEWQL